MMNKYPEVITENILEQNKHISDDEIKGDIEDTLAEITEKELEIDVQEHILETSSDQARRKMAHFRKGAAEDGIERRKEFILLLERLLAARQKQKATN